MTKVSGDETSGNAGAVVAPAPSVRVTDADDRPVPGVEVTFTVALGNGSVTGATVETNTLGIASVGAWTLGTIGSNTLTASSPNLGSLTFSSTASCASVSTLTLGGQASGSLGPTDCRYSDGYLTDRFTFTLTTAGAVRLSQRSTVIDSYVELIRDGEIIAFDNDLDPESGSLDASMRVLLPAGTYQVGASSWEADERGAYVLEAVSATTDLTDCDYLFVVPGVTATQELDATDCPTDDPFYAEPFLLWMEAGRSHTITMSSAGFDTYLLLLREGSNQPIAEDDDGGGGTDSRITHTPAESGFFLIFASSALPSATGAYTLTVQ